MEEEMLILTQPTFLLQIKSKFFFNPFMPVAHKTVSFGVIFLNRKYFWKYLKEKWYAEPNQHSPSNGLWINALFQSYRQKYHRSRQQLSFKWFVN